MQTLKSKANWIIEAAWSYLRYFDSKKRVVVAQRSSNVPCMFLVNKTSCLVNFTKQDDTTDLTQPQYIATPMKMRKMYYSVSDTGILGKRNSNENVTKQNISDTSTLPDFVVVVLISY